MEVNNVKEKLIHAWSRTNRWHRVILVFLIGEFGLLPQGQLGFQCNDPNLSHPYTGDTISWKWLMAVTMFLPLVVMLGIEKVYHNEKTNAAKQLAMTWYKEYLFGFLVNLTIVHILKILVGAPRPHFFDTCRPVEAETCQGSEYVTAYTCTQAHWLSRSNQSFPSGHSSLGVHAALFIAWYIHRRVTRNASSERPLLIAQCALAAAAVACGASRCADHRHHWRDVIAGAVLAVPTAGYTVFKLCQNFKAPLSQN